MGGEWVLYCSYLLLAVHLRYNARRVCDWSSSRYFQPNFRYCNDNNRLYSTPPVVTTSLIFLSRSFSLIASVTACNLRSGFVICPNYRFFIYPNYRSWPRLLMGVALPWLPGLPLNSDHQCWWSSNQRLLKLGYI